MDPTNPQWCWSWLERWMAARPWETQGTAEKDLNSDRMSVKSSVGEITKAFARHQLNSDNIPSPACQKPVSTHQSPATPPTKTSSSVASRKLKPASPSVTSQDEDARSMFSVQSERNRRHSIAGSIIRDDESLASSPSVPSYMAPTRSAKAKSRISSPLGVENGNTPEKGSVGSANKRLSYPPSPARPRRHSGPPKIETSENDANGVVIN